MSNQVFRFKFTDIQNHQDQLKKESGLYFYHIDGSLKYVGISDDLGFRFYGGYLKEDSKQHRNSKLMQLIDSKPNEIEVIFKTMDKELLKEEETKIIQDYIPLCNEKENPRYQVRPIQKVIGKVVNETNCEWSFADMRENLFKKWRGQVSFQRIDEALRDEKNNLGKYCSKKRGQDILMPKKN
ncbi:GIY-YIG nuclease family protein [Peribacillus sp. NPDC060253]|uniref:GIY-YIG nuclease family protein n=1 Tax=Peribacillus sp. NPDC060253 TaxID=3347084 RepID=UPI0036545F40